MANTVINYLVDERGWEVVFGTTMVEIVKLCENWNNSLFFFNRDRFGDT
jgi:hypothetical protein